MSAESEHERRCSSGIIGNVTLTHDAAQLVALHGAELVGVQRNPAAAGEAVPVPAGLAAPLRDALAKQGITSLYRHQLDAVAAVFRGESVLLTTGTASGKSLAYQLPALSLQLARADATALGAYPTKALGPGQARRFAGAPARPRPGAGPDEGARPCPGPQFRGSVRWSWPAARRGRQLRRRPSRGPAAADPSQRAHAHNQPRHAERRHTAAPHAVEPLPQGPVAHRGGRDPHVPRHLRKSRGGGVAPSVAPGQIGRASCRERVEGSAAGL